MTAEEIASDQLDNLQENPDRCAWISVHAGRHPWVRWADDQDAYEFVELGHTGTPEVETCSRDALLNLFAENPVEIKPQSAAMFSPPEPGRENLWEYIEARGEHVTYTESHQ